MTELDQVLERLSRIETKVDSALEVKGRVDAAERDISILQGETSTMRSQINALDKVQAVAKGQLDLLKWMFVVLVAPIVVALAIRGIWAVMDRPPTTPPPQVQVQHASL